MKRLLFCLFAALQCFVLVSAQGGSKDEVFRDTILYDRDWNVVPFREYATYVRYVVEPAARFGLPNKFETYDMNGVMVDKGEHISMGAVNDSSSVFDGGVYRYVDGKLRSFYTYKDGILEGEYMEFFEGETYFKIGEYRGGKPYGHYFMSEYGGKVNSRYDYETEERVVAKPILEPVQVDSSGGVMSLTYQWEGVAVQVKYPYQGKLKGREKVEFVILNNNFEDIEIVADTLYATARYMGDNYDMKVLSYKKFEKKEKAKEITLGIVMGLASGISDVYGGNNSTASVNVNNEQYVVSYYDAEKAAYNRAVREENYAYLEEMYKNRRAGYLHSCVIPAGGAIKGYVWLYNKIIVAENIDGTIKKTARKLNFWDLNIFGMKIDGYDFSVNSVIREEERDMSFDNDNEESEIKLANENLAGAEGKEAVVYRVGDYYPNEDAAVGVVYEVWNGGKNGKVVCSKHANLTWSSDELVVGATSENNGRVNMRMVRDVDSLYVKYPAFAWAEKMNGGGARYADAAIGEWYIPSDEELARLCAVREVVNERVESKIEGIYWSSTEDITDAEFPARYAKVGNYNINIKGQSSNKRVDNKVCLIMEF